MNTISVPHNRLTHDETEVTFVMEVIRSGRWACGVKVKEMELELSSLTGMPFAVGVASGSAALRLALKSLNIKPGDQVIVPAYSCVALANAVLSLEAIPLAVDVEEESWNIDPLKVSMKMNRNVKAIIAVNTFGYPANIEQLKSFNIPVIEDCSHGFQRGASKTFETAISDICVFSFYATKLIAAGEGGAVLCKTKESYDNLMSWRDYTDKKPSGSNFNDKMTDIEASLASCQLGRLETVLNERSKRAAIYEENIKNIDFLKAPLSHKRRIWYRYAVQCMDIDAQKLITECTKSDVNVCRPVDPWLSPQEFVSLPVAQKAYKNIVSLPLFPTLSVEEQNHVISTIQKVY